MRLQSRTVEEWASRKHVLKAADRDPQGWLRSRDQNVQESLQTRHCIFLEGSRTQYPILSRQHEEKVLFRKEAFVQGLQAYATLVREETISIPSKTGNGKKRIKMYCLYNKDIKTPKDARSDMPWIFGYGSLLLRESAEKSMPVLTMRSGVLKGYQRYWGVRSTAKHPCVVLGVRKRATSQCTGTFIKVPEDSFTDIDVRERKYDRVRLQEHEYQALGVRDEVYVYVPKPQWADTPEELQVEYSYLRTCVLGAYEQGCAEEFFTETAGWDRCHEAFMQSLSQQE